MGSIDTAALKGANEIVSVIGSHVALKKVGSEYRGLCPFHDDHTPSFYVVPAKQIWKCFSCNADEQHGNDVIGFVRGLMDMSFTEACEFLGAEKREWKPITPVHVGEPRRERQTCPPPADAPVPRMSTRLLGEPEATRAFRSLDGTLLGYEARYKRGSDPDEPDTSPSRMWTWGAREGEDLGWGCGHFTRPRPLYGLDRIGKRPSFPIAVFEGPKKADAAHRLIGHIYNCISWSGGAGSWHTHDWSPVYGKTLLLWPDADRKVAKGPHAERLGIAEGTLLPYSEQPGPRAVAKLCAELGDPRTHACKIRYIDVSDVEKDGYDIADMEADGMDSSAVIAWAKPRARNYEHLVERQHASVHQDEREDPPDWNYPDDAAHAPAPPRVKPTITGTDTMGEVFYRPMSEVESRAIDWLWPGRIAKGKVSMIVGNPGLGKSQVCASIASVVSNGGAWPVDRCQCGRGSVVILSAEDDPEDTIRPRLEAAGAALDKIYIVDAIRVDRQEGPGKRGFDLSMDIARLGSLLHDLGDPALVIIDPITAYLGDADSHKNAEVRALLAPLSEMAAAQRVAVIAVSHLTKSSGMDALLRVQGSIGFAAAARAVWGVAKDKDNPSRRLFMPLKNNLGTDNSGFAYTVEGIRLPEGDIETSHIMWENELITASADSVFGQADETHDEREAVLEAKMYLRSLLADGPVAVKHIEADARGAGHAWTTVRRAQKDLKIVSYRDHGIGEKGKWYWRLE